MGRKLTSETGNVLMTQIGLAGHALLSADISIDSFFYQWQSKWTIP